MGDAKAHIKGGLAISFILSIVFAYFFYIDVGFVETIKYVLIGLIFGLFAALYPDLDHKMGTLRWYIMGVGWTIFILMYYLRIYAQYLDILIITISLCIYIPIFTKHRGLMHTNWSILPICYLVFIYVEGLLSIYLMAILILSSWTHLLLDGYTAGIKLSPKVILP